MFNFSTILDILTAPLTLLVEFLTKLFGLFS